ncbi:hypothetical protein R3P38DRAFT_3167348 [Favolaschia claudopus]|uniref:Uncharacterized protein n=1 Tax=Favolaschia claudopus TaxID=2862362 RepID=A0AAW0EDR5_9AGAR
MTQPTLKQLFGEQMRRQTTASDSRRSSRPSTRHDAGKQSAKKRKPSRGSDADAEGDEEQEKSKKRKTKKKPS